MVSDGNKGVLQMKREILVSSVLSSVISTLAIALGLTLALPPWVTAQEACIRAEQLVAVGPNGGDRARLFVGPGANASVSVLSTDGRVRALMGTGGPSTQGGKEPETADFVLWAQDGTSIARLGTRETPEGHAAGVDLVLRDSQGRERLDLLVAEDGTPAIHLLDTEGNVTWSTP
jgi:hypothetical protein